MLVLLGGVLALFHTLGGVLTSAAHFFHILSDSLVF
jgi:hypothetical protein